MSQIPNVQPCPLAGLDFMAEPASEAVDGAPRAEVGARRKEKGPRESHACLSRSLLVHIPANRDMLAAGPAPLTHWLDGSFGDRVVNGILY